MQQRSQPQEVETDSKRPYSSLLIDAKGLSFATPLDWSLRMVTQDLSQLFWFVLVSVVVCLVSSVCLYMQPITPQLIFVDRVIVHGVSSWILSCMAMVYIQKLRGNFEGLASVRRDALIGLPKVFIAYSVFVSLFGAGIQFLPMIILAALSFWAPCFCVCELMSVTPVPDEGDENELFLDEDEDESVWPQRVERSFSGFSLFSIGLLRSVQLFSIRPISSCQMFVVFWLVSIAPSAIVFSAYSGMPSLGAQIFLGVVSGGLDVVMLCVYAGVFLRLLSDEQLAELGVQRNQFERLISGDRLRARAFGIIPAFGHRPFVCLWLCVLVLWCSYQYSMVNYSVAVPRGATISVENVVKDGDDLVVSLFIEDENNRFLWLDLDRFCVMFSSGEGGLDERLNLKSSEVKDNARVVVESSASDQSGGLSSKYGASEYGALKYDVSDKILQTSGRHKIVRREGNRDLIYDGEGNLLDRRFFKPSAGTLRVVLRFPIPVINKNSTTGSHKLRYNLYYVDRADRIGVSGVDGVENSGVDSLHTGVL